MTSLLPEVSVVWGIFIFALLVLRRFSGVDPEVSRKALHAVMGLVALSLPWIFTSVWPVTLLTGSFIVLLWAIRMVPALRRGLGGIIHGVGRNSWGEIYFAAAVGAAFALSHGQPRLYSIAILILAIADSASSLVGRRYGHLRYQVWGGGKSVEGSLAFLVSAFLIANLGLMRFTSLGSPERLLVAFALSFPLTLIEAVAGKGSDNFILPIGALFILKWLLALSAAELVAVSSIAVVTVPMALSLLLLRTHGGSAEIVAARPDFPDRGTSYDI